MTAGELALVVGALLCAITFAAFVVTLVRVRDTVVELRRESAALRSESAAAARRLNDSAAAAERAAAEARADLDRFDRLLGSAEAISSVAGRSGRLGRAALSAPMIKAAGLATGTTRAVRRLRSET